MNCPVCEAEMQPLFTGHYCPSCEARGSKPVALEETFGFIIWRSRPEGSHEYVFKTEQNAAAWRAAAGLTHFPIRLVMTRTEFAWRESTGSVAGVYLADRLFEIYRDRETDQLGKNQARLVPEKST